MLLQKISLILFLFYCTFVAQVAQSAGSEYFFHGNLVAEPCTLMTNDNSVELSFGTIVDKYLYANGRTASQLFELHLQDCDTALGESVAIRFAGTESLSLPGMLAVSSPVNSGIAIGLEAKDGTPLVLNEPGNNFSLHQGSNVLAIQAYVAGEPAAIENKTIMHGEFTAVATFELIYQ